MFRNNVTCQKVYKLQQNIYKLQQKFTYNNKMYTNYKKNDVSK